MTANELPRSKLRGITPQLLKPLDTQASFSELLGQDASVIVVSTASGTMPLVAFIDTFCVDLAAVDLKT